VLQGVPAVVALAVAAAMPGLAACGDNDEGRTLRPPSPDQTTTTVATTSTTAGVDAGSATGDTGSSAEGSAGAAADATTTTLRPMRLSSSAIPEGGEFPAELTCRGADMSPPLLWTDVPAGTAELAVVVRDVDADGFVHWVVAGMPATTGGIAQATSPAGAVEATNDFGRPGWAGPCPPSGTHHYDIRVYALAEPSGVAAGQPGAEAAALIEATPGLASAVLSASASAG
jgi:Raf kinase inhibitor-like YbhB/YbcL family protein